MYLPSGSVSPKVTESILEPVVDFIESKLFVRRLND